MELSSEREAGPVVCDRPIFGPLLEQDERRSALDYIKTNGPLRFDRIWRLMRRL